jgi:hypothetical protein
MNELQSIGWQDILVWAAILLAVVYLFSKQILPRLRREPVGCEKCAAYQAITDRRGVTVKKLTPEETEKLRSELRQ